EDVILVSVNFRQYLFRHRLIRDEEIYGSAPFRQTSLASSRVNISEADSLTVDNEHPEHRSVGRRKSGSSGWRRGRGLGFRVRRLCGWRFRGSRRLCAGQFIGHVDRGFAQLPLPVLEMHIDSAQGFIASLRSGKRQCRAVATGESTGDLEIGN